MMKILFIIVTLILNCEAAFATIIIRTDYIKITPANATSYGVTVIIYTNSEQVLITMPLIKGEFSFDRASLEAKSGVRHFNIPVYSMPVDIEPAIVFIAFLMDRETLRESTLKINFTSKREHDSVYIFSMKDFMPKSEKSPGK